MRRGGDVQIVDMALRRVQTNLRDAEKLEVSLKALVKYSNANVEYLAKRKVIPKMIEIMEIHENDPRILESAATVLTNMLPSPNDTDKAQEMYENDVIPVVVKAMKTFAEDLSLQRVMITLVGIICNCAVDDECDSENVKNNFFDEGVLTVVVDAMRNFTSDALLCDAGTWIVYWFECAANIDIRRAICSNPLNIAIEASITDFQSSDRKLHRGDAEQLKELLSYPELIEAMDKDPVMGVVRKVYELHKDSVETIREKGLEVQFAVIERQKGEAKLFTCMNCDKKLSKKERLICSSCRVAIYCSKDCQRQHWKRGHKSECKRK